MTAPPPAIVADGFSFRYAGDARAAIDDVSFELEPGAVLLVVGPSGSGKSTLARAVAGLLPGEFAGELTGSLRVGDGAPGAASTRAGILFQDPASQLVMDRAGDDVAFGLENLGWPRAAMRERVPEALAEVGLAGFEDRHANRLSGGEQQRLALAGILAPGPGVLVLDEPTANLDPDGAAALFERLTALRAARRTTIVLVEHRVDRAWPLADTVLALGDDGRPIDAGPATTVLRRSRTQLRAAGVWLPEDLEPIAADGASGSATPDADPRRPDSTLAGPDRGGEARVLEIHGVRFAYPDAEPALRDIELRVAAGDRVALVGPNGSGKSTLLRLALGLLRPQAGSVRLAGFDPARLPPTQLATLAGFAAQDPELGFIADTVGEEIALGLDRPASRYAADLADRLSLPLERFRDRSPYRLSGGEQRRLSLVTALARRPRLLVLDEPTYGQDRRGHEALVAALDELLADGSAMLAATHDEPFIRAAATRRVELAEGWIVADELLVGPEQRRSRARAARQRC